MIAGKLFVGDFYLVYVLLTTDDISLYGLKGWLMSFSLFQPVVLTSTSINN